MFFDHYPYTNFHNVNLDWVLQAVKAWGQTVDANNLAFQDLKAANESFKAFVTGYLTNLDVSEEINDKLDDMLTSGVLSPYLAPYVQTDVNAWLAANITPTSPPLDASLTLANAAAPANLAGVNRDAIANIKDLAPISLQPVYTTGYGINSQGALISRDTRIATISYIRVSTSERVRITVTEGYRVWGAFYNSQSEGSFVASFGWITTTTDVVVRGAYMRLSIASLDDATTPTAAAANVSLHYVLMDSITELTNKAYTFKGQMDSSITATLGDIRTFGVYSIGTGQVFPDAPQGFTSGSLLVLNAYSGTSTTVSPYTQLIQVLIDTVNHGCWMRHCNTSYVWRDWIHLNIADNIITKTKWLALGDSITAGVYSVEGGGNVHNVTNQGWAPQLATTLGYELTKLGSAGMGYTASITGRLPETPQNSTPRISMDDLLTQVEAMTDDFNLVTIMFGTNDYGTPSATIDTIRTGCMDCLNRVSAKFPGARIVCFTPLNIYAHKVDGVLTPYGSSASKFAYNTANGSKTLSQISAAIKECCDSFGIECVDLTTGFVLNTNNMPGLLLDGTHPSLACYKLIAKALAHILIF